MTGARRFVLRQFRTRRLESLLIVVATALGVAVVTAVAAFLDIGRQAEARFRASLSAREILVQASEDAPELSSAAVRRVGAAGSAPVELGEADLARAKEAAPSVAYAYLQQPRGMTRGSSEGVSALAITQDYLGAARIRVKEGSAFSESDFEEGRNVMLVTEAAQARLNLGDDPIGKTVDFNSTPGFPTYTVIGVLSEPLERSPGIVYSQFYPDALVPFRSNPLDANWPPFYRVTQLYFATDDADAVDAARAELEAFARETWGEDRVVLSSLPNRRQIGVQGRVTGLVIAAFAAVGLLMAALNIMNLMLARVLKRQRSIGILRSLGASRGAIRAQFLGEALTLGLVGGLLGIPAGYGLLAGYTYYQSLTPQAQPFTLTLSPTAALLGLALAVAVGLLFGLYPALVASRVRVVEALRET